jgi:hypothetical protein
VTIEPRSSRYRHRQIDHLATDGVLAKDSLDPVIAVSNRLMITTYCLWFAIAAWRLGRR